MSRLAFKESIADLWGYPDVECPRRPETKTLFEAIAGEALACLSRSDWSVRIKRIENILSVIKFRMDLHWQSWVDEGMERAAKRLKEASL